jgi:hypothetical protein
MSELNKHTTQTIDQRIERIRNTIANDRRNGIHGEVDRAFLRYCIKYNVAPTFSRDKIDPAYYDYVRNMKEKGYI